MRKNNSPKNTRRNPQKYRSDINWTQKCIRKVESDIAKHKIFADDLFDGTFGGSTVGIPDIREGFAKDRGKLRQDARQINGDMMKALAQVRKKYGL